MRIDRGMQRSACKEHSVLGWKESFSKGIGITTPKVRTRDKGMLLEAEIDPSTGESISFHFILLCIQMMTRIFVQRGSAGSPLALFRRYHHNPEGGGAGQGLSLGGQGEFIDYSGSSEDKSDKKDEERERLFELEIRRAKGFEVKRMAEDGNCLFRAVADQVYGDSESYDMVRQLSIDYMERERDHFSQFITEGFTSYCKRKRRDNVYGNNVEIPAFAEMYNRPNHIYCYSTEPINIFHGNYDTDTPPIRLSYHHGNHYNSLVDPRRLTIGAGLGFSSLQGRNIDREQVKAAIRAQQDQQIDNALIAEGRFYSDLELTEKEIERMVMEASRAEYLAEDKLKQQLAFRETSTSGAEPSSSSGTAIAEGRKEKIVQQQQQVLSSSMQLVLSMGFSYLQVMEAYGIFGDDVDSMVCYLLETGIGGGGASSPGRRKGKAAE